jgi:hypothetical protein
MCNACAGWAVLMSAAILLTLIMAASPWAHALAL